MSGQHGKEILYLWTIDDHGIHSCYVVDTVDKAVHFIESGIPPRNSRYLLSRTNDVIDPVQLRQLCQLKPGNVVGPRLETESLVSRVSGRKLFYRSGVGDSLPRETPQASPLMDTGPDQQQLPLVKVPPVTVRTLAEAAEELDHSLTERKRAILSDRLTGYSARKTLEETSEPFGVSRERIRQLEVEIVRDFARSNDDILAVAEQLPSFLAERDESLPLDDLGNHFPELKGAEKWWRLLMVASGRSLNKQIHLLPNHGVQVVSLLSEDEFASIVRDQREFLRVRVEGAPDYQVQELRKRILADARLIQPGLVEIVLAEVLQHAHTMEQDGKEVVVSYGRGANSAVLAVLHASDTPLTFEQAYEELDQSYDIRRVHNAMQEKTIQLGWGTYGLRKHIPFDDSQLLDIASIAEEAIVSDDPERQWHAQDIYEMILAESPELNAEVLTVYHVEYALSLSEELVSLRRLVWGLRSTFDDSADARVDRLQMVEEILEAAGHPLSNTEIKEQADQIRGTGQYFQVFGGGRVIRVGRGIWGLRDRDVPWSDETLQELTELMFQSLLTRDMGMFISEVHNQDFIPTQDLDQTRALAFLFCEDDRFALNRGGSILYLRSWGEPRRLTLKRAIRSVFEGTNAEYTREELIEVLRAMTGLHLEPLRISMALSTSPHCEFRASSSLWVSIEQEALVTE